MANLKNTIVNGKLAVTEKIKSPAVEATTFSGSGASLTSLNASNLASGTVNSNRLPTVPVTKGGTGATTAAAALTNLGLTATATELNYTDGVTSNIQTQLNNKASKYSYTATIPTTGWSSSAPYTVTISVSGITASDTPDITVVLSTTAATAKLQLAAWNCVSKIDTGANQIVCTCYEEKPTTAIPILIKGVR